MKINHLFAFFVTNSINFVVTYIVAHLINLCITLGYLLISVFHIRISQMDHLIKTYNMETFNEAKLKRLLKEGKLNIKIMRDGSRIYGNCLLVGVIVAIPSNALIVMHLLMTTHPLLSQVFLFFVALVEILAIFVMQSYCALISKKMVYSSGRMYRISVKAKRLNSFQVKWKLCTNIEFFHSTNVQSITYGKFGKITFWAIKKV